MNTEQSATDACTGAVRKVPAELRWMCTILNFECLR